MATPGQDNGNSEVRLAEARRDAARQKGDYPAYIQAVMYCGMAEFTRGDLGMARLHFRHAIVKIRQTGAARHLLPELMGMAGRALQRQKRWEQALQNYKKAAQEAARQKLFTQQLRWAGKEATTTLDIGDQERGLDLLEKSVRLGRRLFKKETDVAEELARQLGCLANELVEADGERSGELWEEAFAILKKAGSPASHFLAARNYTVSLERKGRYRLAQTYLEEALEIGVSGGLDPERLAEASLQLGEMYRRQNMFERGGDYLLLQSTHVQDPRSCHELLAAAVNCYFAGSLWEKMKPSSAQLRQLRDAQGTALGRYDAAMRYAIACRELGDLTESITALDAALKFASEAEDQDEVTKAKAQKALVLTDQKQFVPAADIYQELWEAGTKDPLTAVTYLQCRIALGDLDSAERIRAEFKKAGGEDAAGQVALMSARLADAGRGRTLSAWNRVLRMADGNLDLIGTALDRLVELYRPRSEQRLQAARRRARLAEHVRSQVSDVFSDHAWRAVTRRFDRLGPYLDFFLVEASSAKRFEDAIYELERFRSQALVDVISERSNLWSGEDKTLEFKGHFTDEAQRARYRFEALAATNASWAARRQAAQTADNAEDMAFRADVIVLGDDGRGMHFPEDLQEHLRGVNLQPGEVLVFQRTMKDRSLLWFMNADRSIVHRALPDFTSETTSRIRASLWTAHDGSEAAARREGGFPWAESAETVGRALRELDETLAAPVIEALQKMGARMAFLVAGTELVTLPVNSCESWQRSKIDVSFLPSARALGFSRTGKYAAPRMPFLFNKAGHLGFAKEQTRKREQRGLVVADPTDTLRYASLEAAAVALEVNAFTVDTLSGPKANERTLSAAASDVGLFHLISHGEFDDASPYRSGIYTAESEGTDGMWMVAEVFSDVRAVAGRLAVLSACDTGRVQPNVVSEDISLPSAFLAAGFSAVVATRWAIDDLSTALLVGEFYRRWGTGQVGVSEALRQAAEWLRTLDRNGCKAYLEGLIRRLKQLKSPIIRNARQVARGAVAEIEGAAEYPFENPRHWAAFYVVGDGALTGSCLPSQRLKSSASGPEQLGDTERNLLWKATAEALGSISHFHYVSCREMAGSGRAPLGRVSTVSESWHTLGAQHRHPLVRTIVRTGLPGIRPAWLSP
jgi:CHAT domain-containing protein/tetratricopeptide (TPR) repeat protein